MHVQVRQLQALVSVVDEGSFTDAAIALGVSQASVSRSVAALERAVGARVMRRSARRADLTPAGARILGHARRVLLEIEAIEQGSGGEEMRVGYAWSALGGHTSAVQKRWSATHPGAPLTFVQSNTPTAGLREGIADIAVLRRRIDDDRFEQVLVGVEARHAALASGDALARRRTLTLSALAGRVIAVDHRTGTTTERLWPPDIQVAGTREIHGVDEWLTLIGSGEAVGITSAATTRQHPRRGIVYRRVTDAPPVAVWLAWWRDSEPPLAGELVQVVCEAYTTDGGIR